jgi:hypothetical protein
MGAPSCSAGFAMRRSIYWRIVLPIPILTGLTLGLAWFWLPSLVTRNAVEAAIESAQQTALQFKTLRGYYTKAVVAKVIAGSSLRPNFDHAHNDGAIPLPATMIHDLSDLLKNKGTRINLYSPLPFPNRRDRKLDDFAKAAWAFLEANPDRIYSRHESVDGKEVVRAA